MALSKTERVPRSEVGAQGVRRSFVYGTLKMLPSPVKGAVVVSKKVFKTAPARNRVRRRVSEILRALVRSKKLTRGVVVYPNAAALKAPHTELKAALLRALAG